MLQQTTVGAVRGRYEEFLERFPDLASLARASEEDVLAAWSGLGYYARARHLHRAARELIERRGGRWPRQPEELRELPGFGEYMAAAVASIAFDAREPAADANVRRVLSRLDAIGGAASSRAHVRAVTVRAGALVARGRPGDVLAALMDLGQLVCTPRRPSCSLCPVANLCVARARGAVSRFPLRRPRPKATRVHVAAACAVRGGSALLLRTVGSRLGGLWQFPSAEGPSAGAARRRLERSLRPLGIVLEHRPPAAARHTIMHRRLDIRVYRARLATPRSPGPGASGRVAAAWFTPSSLDRAAIPTLTRRIAGAVGFLSPA